MKHEIRKRLLEKRDNLSGEFVAAASKTIQDFLIGSSWYAAAESIMVYNSFGNEVSTKAIISHSLNIGKAVYIPLCITKTKEIVACRIFGNEDLTPGRFGILEPDRKNIFIGDRRQVQLLIVPGIAFDCLGNRIGFGAGYYDRFLSSFKHRPAAVSLAYSFQVLERLPADPLDVPVDAIITENGILSCNTL